MMNNHLTSFYIEKFRRFKRLEIKQFGQINLITGQNNIGKSCLLEAVWLYGTAGDPHVIQEILRNRGELRTNDISAINRFLHNQTDMLSNSWDSAIKISQSEDSSDDEFVIKLDFANNQSAPIADAYRIDYEKTSGEKPLVFLQNSPILVIKQHLAEDRIINHTFQQIYPNKLPSTHKYQFVPSKGITFEKIVDLWDTIDLTSLQDDVIHALQIIDPNVRGIGLDVREQLPNIRIGNKRWLLSSLGEGMNRIFELALALVNAKDGFLMIDEIENGLFYENQHTVWGFIFEVAKRLNVQVFVTTHGKDTIEAFDYANRKHEDVEGILISLRQIRNKPGEVVGITFDTEDIEYLVDSNTEVR